jgi:hypothetical protein
MGIDILGLLVLFGASARLWHLGATDKLSLPVRERLPATVTLWLECHRCGGFWWALAAVGLFVCTRSGPAWAERSVDIVLIALAANWLFVAARETIATIVALVEARTRVITGAHRAAAERSEWPA